MVKILRLFAVLLGLTTVWPAWADDNATADEAVAMVKKAVATYKAEGRDKAFAAFQDANGAFQYKDLYIFVQDMDGKMLSHGKNPGLIGKDLSHLKDADGKEFVGEMMKLAKSTGSGWVDYKWVNPASKKIQAKSSYVEAAGDVFIGAGIYK
jgi:cytochrome c